MLDKTPSDEVQTALESKLIFDSIQFMTTLTELYGNDKGMELWNKFGEVIGAELQGKVFFALLSGTKNAELSIRTEAAHYNGNAVAVIKVIREYTGYGLKEAKDVYDNAKHIVTQVACLDYKMRDEFARSLRVLGCKVF